MFNQKFTRDFSVLNYDILPLPRVQVFPILGFF